MRQLETGSALWYISPFQMERRLDKTSLGFLTPIHVLRGPGDQFWALIMVIENQNEIVGWLAIIFAELVNPLNCFAKDRLLEFVRVMGIWRLGLPNPNIEDKAAEISDFVEQAVCEVPEL